jgi:hypothetical protein
MKTLKEIYNPPAPTPAEILAWSESLKFGRRQVLELRTGKVLWGRDYVGILSASCVGTGLAARIPLKKAAPTVGWAGVPVPPPEPIEPRLEGAETELQREQGESLLSHVRREVRAWLRSGEWEAIVDSRKAVKAEVSELRRKAKMFDKKDAKPFIDKARSFARFAQVKEIDGLRVCYWPERGCWRVAEYHTGQPIGVPSVKAKAGKKSEVMGALMSGVRDRLAEVGLDGIVEALKDCEVINE